MERIKNLFLGLTVFCGLAALPAHGSDAKMRAYLRKYFVFSQDNFNSFFNGDKPEAQNLVILEKFLVKHMGFTYHQLLGMAFKAKQELILREFKKYGIEEHEIEDLGRKRVTWADSKPYGNVVSGVREYQKPEFDETDSYISGLLYKEIQKAAMMAAMLDVDQFDNVAVLERHVFDVYRAFGDREPYLTLLEESYDEKKNQLFSYILNSGL